MDRITAVGGDAESTTDPLVRGRDIEKAYGSRLPFTRSVEVLAGADIEVEAGEIVGIVGENGSGKSTLMKILVGVLEADAGTIDRGGTIGWCPQEPLLYDRLTVAETFRLFGAGYGMDRDAIEAARDWLAERLGFERFLDYRIDQLSGGNEQKINLAVALMHDPDVLFLDEPYTGFDWETYLRFWEMTDELAEAGTAIVMISHLIEERSRLDRIYEVRDGHADDVTGEEQGTASDQESTSDRENAGERKRGGDRKRGSGQERGGDRERGSGRVRNSGHVRGATDE